MRTKSLLIAAVATLAAGVVTSQAQVYSQNIVGYVNTTIPNGFVNVNNPLDASDPTSGLVNNSVTNIFPVFSGNLDGSVLNIWNGTKYVQYTIDSSWGSGIGNGADTAQVNPPPVINPGAGFFFQNTLGVATTNTFVGTVHVDAPAAGTNVVGTTTNILTSSPYLTYVSSKLPIGGGVSSVLQLPAGGVLDGALIQIPIIGANGGVAGFTTVTIDSSWSTGFGNAADTAQVPEPVIPVGAGFFFENTLGAPQQWIQNY
jgi:hypothetical protein